MPGQAREPRSRGGKLSDWKPCRHHSPVWYWPELGTGLASQKLVRVSAWRVRTGSWGVVRGPHYQVYAIEWIRWHYQLIYLHEGPKDSGMSSPFSPLRHLHDKRKFSWKCVWWTVTFIIYWHQDLKAQSIHQSRYTHPYYHATGGHWALALFQERWGVGSSGRESRDT